ncbi:MAG TPA: hypothetical protein VHR45_15215 [Thermoanaerobaculia bacterium]|nr:hypothetical protein [Thermoanaerobaculia bacterium]
MSAPSPNPSVTAVPPEAGRCWIRYVPRSWEAPAEPWTDLAAGRLGRPFRQPPELEALAEALDDVVYLPPVPRRLAERRDDLARALLAAGTPVVLQLLAGESSSPWRAAGSPAGSPVDLNAASSHLIIVVDLLPALLGDAGRRPGRLGLDALALPPAGAVAAVWPLLPGLTDDPDLWEKGCRRLAAAGVPCVQALAPALSPAERRRLAEGAGAEVFAALFHHPPPSERDFARLAHRHGLAPFLARPLPRPPLLGAGNRRIGGHLELAAELSLRLGRPAEEAQALFRAARWIDATSYDVEALAREGNLGVVAALDAVARRAVAESAAGGEPALLDTLLADYLGAEPRLDRTGSAAPEARAASRGRPDADGSAD